MVVCDYLAVIIVLRVIFFHLYSHMSNNGRTPLHNFIAILNVATSCGRLAHAQQGQSYPHFTLFVRFLSRHSQRDLTRPAWISERIQADVCWFGANMNDDVCSHAEKNHEF